jgi:bacterioferritin-associated ferredoxin
MGVSSVRIAEAIRSRDLSTRAEVAEATRAGSACGTATRDRRDPVSCAARPTGRASTTGGCATRLSGG